MEASHGDDPLMKRLLFNISIGLIISTITFGCVKSEKARIVVKVKEFEIIKSEPIQRIIVSPAYIGPDLLTVRQNIIIKDEGTLRKIVDLISLPERPSLPESMEDSMFVAGCSLEIVFSGEKPFCFFTMFREKGGMGRGVEYKLSLGSSVESEDDENLPEDYALGHGFSEELYYALRDAIKSSSSEKQIWVFSKQSPNNPIRLKVNEFEAVRAEPIQQIEIFPVNIGPERLTVKEHIVIDNKRITRQIVDLIFFTENPMLPENMEHSGFVSGCSLRFVFLGKKEFFLFIMFLEGPKGHGIEYKLSLGSNVKSGDDKNLPGNHVLGHGFSEKLYNVLHEAIKSSGEKKPVWVASEW